MEILNTKQKKNMQKILRQPSIYLNSLFLILPLIISFQSFGQAITINEETGKYTKQEVIEFDSISKDELFNKAIEWITLNYNSANDVIQLSDKETGKIILKGNFSTNLWWKQGWIRHTLILEFKDNRFRYTYTDLSYYSAGSGEVSFEGKMAGKKKALAETEENIDNSIASLTNYIKKPIQEDDW